MTELVDSWNQHRRENPEWQPELSDKEDRTILSNVRLCYKNEQGIWTGADLSGVTLFGADLTGADLHAVDFRGAMLSHATLADTELNTWRRTGRANASEACFGARSIAAFSFSVLLHKCTYCNCLGEHVTILVVAELRLPMVCAQKCDWTGTHDVNFVFLAICAECDYYSAAQDSFAS